MSNRFVLPIQSVFDGNGSPLSDATLSFYVTGTTTPLNTYKDAALTTPHTNPVVANSAGRFPAIFMLSQVYKAVLKDSGGSTIWTEDPVVSPVISAFGATLVDDANAATARTTLGSAASGANSDITALSGLTTPLSIAQGGTGAATAAAALTALGPPTRGYIDGLILSPNGAAPTTTLDIAAGQARDSTDAATFDLTATTKKVDTAWAAGSGAGGLLDTGAIGGTAWYHVYLIEKDSDGSVDVGLDTSASTPSLPTGYSRFRRIGAVKTDGSGLLIAFVQHGDEFWWETPVLDVSTGSLTSLTSFTLTVPSGFPVLALLNVVSNGANNIYLHDPAVADQVSDYVASPLVTQMGTGTGDFGSGPARIWTNASRQIQNREASAGLTIRIATLGWVDPRGRNA